MLRIMTLAVLLLIGKQASAYDVERVGSLFVGGAVQTMREDRLP